MRRGRSRVAESSGKSRWFVGSSRTRAHAWRPRPDREARASAPRRATDTASDPRSRSGSLPSAAKTDSTRPRSSSLPARSSREELDPRRRDRALAADRARDRDERVTRPGPRAASSSLLRSGRRSGRVRRGRCRRERREGPRGRSHARAPRARRDGTGPRWAPVHNRRRPFRRSYGRVRSSGPRRGLAPSESRTVATVLPSVAAAQRARVLRALLRASWSCASFIRDCAFVDTAAAHLRPSRGVEPALDRRARRPSRGRAPLRCSRRVASHAARAASELPAWSVTAPAWTRRIARGSRSRSARSCETRTRIPRKRPSADRRSVRASASRWFVGSSRKSTSGSRASAAPICHRFRSPGRGSASARALRRRDGVGLRARRRRRRRPPRARRHRGWARRRSCGQ